MACHKLVYCIELLYEYHVRCVTRCTCKKTCMLTPAWMSKLVLLNIFHFVFICSSRVTHQRGPITQPTTHHPHPPTCCVWSCNLVLLRGNQPLPDLVVCLEDEEEVQYGLEDR